MMYVIADTHFFDEHLLGVDNFAPRPFESVDQMNKVIIQNWNARVTNKDLVYHLGDIAVNYTKPPRVGDQQVFELLQQLHGRLVLIKGNHDRRGLFKYLAGHNYEVDGQLKFEFHDVGKLIKYNHQQLYMTHYPMMMGIAPQILNLHGHIHHYMVPSANNINVGVDAPELAFLDHQQPFGTPILLREVEQIAKEKAARLVKDKIK
ncbi:metallophosphoesterase [uncultured Limosilactobacillus sp.]|uniref:metallophosphoesterase n=1 Tax=uncultured Limosilactobacillus sp. TaxID=2837629 RepID=UPI0025FA7460|nr:metallophosphoesterase [uncultured Limosilactobacillus sp.]